MQENYSHLYREFSRIGFAEAFYRIGLDYKKFRHTIWNREEILDELKKIMEKRQWKETSHLKKYKSKLYNAINRDISFYKAFSEIGLNYKNYKYK